MAQNTGGSTTSPGSPGVSNPNAGFQTNTPAAAVPTNTFGQSVSQGGGSIVPSSPGTINTPKPISVDTMSKSQTPVNIPPAPTPDTGASTVASLPDFSAAAATATQSTPAETEQTSILGRIADLMKGRSSLDTLKLQQESAAGTTSGLLDVGQQINDLTAHQQSLSDQSQLLADQYTNTRDNLIPNQEQLDATGRGITAAGLAPIQAADLRRLQIDYATKSAVINSSIIANKALMAAATSKQSNLTLVKELADKAAQVQYDATTQELDHLNSQIAAIQPQLTRDQKAQADVATAQIAAAQKQNDANIANRSNAITEAAKYANVASPSILAQMRDAKDAAEVGQIAAKNGIQLPVAGRYKDVMTTDAFGNQVPRILDSTTGKFIDAAPNTTAADLNSPNNGSNTGSFGTATSTVSRITGIDPTTPLSKVDPQALAVALIHNEGSSPAGVKNNPGNIKYAGLPGQTDSGVKATDGGTFASYSTPDAGKQAIVNNIKSSQSKNPDATMGSFVDRYTNTAPTTKSFDQYGLLANTNFNETNTVDNLAAKYMDSYLKNGTVPTASTMGRSMKPSAVAAVDSRARELYFQATGQPMPNPEIIKGYQAQLIGNNKLLNNLNIQEGVVGKNAALLLQNLTANNLNDNSQPINAFIDGMRNMLGDPAVGQYLAQNATVSNELGSLLSLKNAQGTTVHDKLEAAGIINKSDSQAQIAAKVKILLQEAVNSHDTLMGANKELYKQTDPLLQDANNPLRISMKVDNVLKKQGVDSSDIISKTPAGQIAVIDNASGQPGYIPSGEFNSSKYTKIQN